MKNLVIIGAGDLGKEIVWLVEDINNRKPTYLILGFLDDDLSKVGSEFYGYKVLGSTKLLKELSVKMDLYAVVAIQNGSIRKAIVEALSGFDHWESIVHPTVTIASTSSVGKGSVFFPQTIVSVDSVLGSFGLYYIRSTICNDCRIGDYVSIMSGAIVSEHVRIDDECILPVGVCVYPNQCVEKGAAASLATSMIKRG